MTHPQSGAPAPGAPSPGGPAPGGPAPASGGTAPGGTAPGGPAPAPGGTVHGGPAPTPGGTTPGRPAPAYDHAVADVDALIVGAGPVGLYAAYYAGFRGLSVGVLDSLPEIGGQVSAMYPGKADL